MRTCKVCKVEKELEKFAKNKICKLGVEHTCRTCATQRGILWERTNIEARKNAYMKYTYGITAVQYNSMRDAQGNICDICKKPETVIHKKYNKVKDLVVDHNHSNGAVRGLLCTRCNTAIGLFKEDIESLESAILYLRKHGK